MPGGVPGGYPAAIIDVDAPPAGPSIPQGHVPLRTRLAASAGAAVSDASRRLGRGDGSVVGGRVTLAIAPDALRHLAMGHASVLVSGTNGKTTTTRLLATALGTAGPVVTNLLGANLPPGLVTTLASGPPGATAALEVDEAWLARVVAATRPAAVLLLNLSRDQLDRNNEVRTLANGWRRALAGRPRTVVVANADDPLVAWGAGTAPKVVWVGAGQPWTADAAGCPACGGRIVFGEEDAGAWACSACDLRRPALHARLQADVAVLGDRRIPLDLTLPGRANRANALMALTAAAELGVDVDAAARALAATDEVAGRYRTVTVDGVRARMLLAKNPAGWLEVLDVVRPAPQPVVVVINARIADGRDPSWLWDVPFERLAGRLVVASGERGRDLAVRLHYAGVDQRFVADPVEAVRAATAAARQAGGPTIDVVANYTSFQQLRTRLP